jgi:hypothetical protein
MKIKWKYRKVTKHKFTLKRRITGEQISEPFWASVSSLEEV